METKPARVIALSEPGAGLARKIRSILEDEGQAVQLHLPPRFARPEQGEFPINVGFKTLVADSFSESSCLVFVTAAGIAVRAIASEIKDKKTDPAVLVVDNQGRFVISLLSGHLGKANQWTRKLAVALGATPVITTASDSLGIPALDELAAACGWAIENWEAVKPVMAAIINGDRVLAAVDSLAYLKDVRFPPNVEVVPVWEIPDTGRFAASFVITTRTDLTRLPEPLLHIRPRNVIIGIGCKRGIPKERIVSAIRESLQAASRSLAAVRCLATIALKRDDAQLLEAASSLGLPVEFVEASDLTRVERSFSFSPFVKSRVGVGNVCETAAYLCGRHPNRVLGKTSYAGITIAIFEEIPKDCV